jgi:hypothetical protein
MQRIMFTLALVVALSPRSTAAQDPTPGDATALAKQTQNPVGDLVSVPLQFNFFTAGDLEDRTSFTLNVQPVIPFGLTSKVNAIARAIFPVSSVPGVNAGTRFTGTGDIQVQLFLTPKQPGKIIWGIGPMFSLPTATAFPLTTGSWATGPAAVLVGMPGPFVVGALVTQVWTFADDDTDPEVNQFLVQPFLNYNFGKGWALSVAPSITANWDANPGQRWTVPLGVGLSRTTIFNGRPMNTGVQYYYNIERPDGAGASQIRFTLSLLYPTHKG